MGWLTGPVIGAVVIAGCAIYLYDHILVAGVHGIVAGVGRACLAVGVGTSVITAALLRGFDDRTRWFKRGSKEVGRRPKSLPKIKRFW